MAVESVGLPFHAHPGAPWGAINISMCCHGRAGDNTMTGLLGGDQNEVTEVTEVCTVLLTVLIQTCILWMAWVKRQALVRKVVIGFFKSQSLELEAVRRSQACRVQRRHNLMITGRKAQGQLLRMSFVDPVKNSEIYSDSCVPNIQHICTRTTIS